MTDAWRDSLGDWSAIEWRDIAAGAQTERRGGAGPVGACLAVRTPPAAFQANRGYFFFSSNTSSASVPTRRNSSGQTLSSCTSLSYQERASFLCPICQCTRASHSHCLAFPLPAVALSSWQDFSRAASACSHFDAR